MSGDSVLPVPGVEVMRDGRFIRPIPALSTLNSKGSKWWGVALESFCNVPGCNIPEHEHPNHFLNLLTGGTTRARWRSDGQTRTAVNDPGTIYLLPRGTRDSLSWSDASSRIVVVLEPDFLAKSLDETAHLPDVELKPHWELHDRHIASLMLALHADLEDGSPAGPMYGESLANALAVYLIRRYAVRPPHERATQGGLPTYRLRRVLEHIEANLASDLRLGDLAQIASMSPHYFGELFRQSMGMTPHQYLAAQRIERAKQLLRSTSLTPSEVALTTGFADQSHFTKVFRRIAGTTPGRFRAERVG